MPHRLARSLLALLALLATLALAGCDLLGIESGSQIAAKRDAEGRAIGAACRHAARSIEACYELNKRADKAAVFAGWREMEDYMRDNKIQAQPAHGSTEVAQAPGYDAGKSDKAEETEQADETRAKVPSRR
jgi:hypothetical protein